MDGLWYGGDYNPEQWSPATWDEDIRLMREAGVNIVTVGVFSWAVLEVSDGQFDFEWLDDILDRLHAAGIRVDLATGTASPPPWLVAAHPDVLPVTEDGVRLGGGSRQHYNPSSATYRRYATRLVERLAERYGTHPALEAWHINNEYGCHVNRDYSAETANRFRDWLEVKYSTIDALNHAWGTAFWSQRYSTFTEIEPPRTAPSFRNPTQLLDFDRFSSHALLECFRMEATVLRRVTPDIPVTTNFMGAFQPVDYWEWASELDFVSNDQYPDPTDPTALAHAAMTCDLMRSLGLRSRRGTWVLMEQAADAVNWRSRNAAMPTGMHRFLSLQAVARGADGIMQFQWRQSRTGAEKFHSAMLPHAGTDTRIFRDTVALGRELIEYAPLQGIRTVADVAIVFDWDSWWAHSQDAVPADIDYEATVFAWHQALTSLGATVDFVPADGPFDEYAVVIAPTLQVLSEAACAALERFCVDGGTLLVSYQSGILDQNLHAYLDGYLGGLQGVLGVRIEAFAPPPTPAVGAASTYPLEIDGVAAGSAGEWAERVHTTSATAFARFLSGELGGEPAITRNAHGSGTAWYVATLPEHLQALLEVVLADAQVTTTRLPSGVELLRRGATMLLLNGTDRTQAARLDGALRTIPPYSAVSEWLSE